VGKVVKKPLSRTHPKLAKEADGWNPNTVVAGSHRRLSWKCKRGHRWDAIVKNRTSQNQGCPFCSGKRIVRGVNDLATNCPEVAKEADGWDPRDIHKTSNKRLPWKCNKGHTWRALVNNRSLRGDSCPVCSGKKVLAGFNDLATLEPSLALEADGWDPTTLTKFSNKRVQWKCKEGHTWKVKVNSRTTFKTGCPTCSGQQILSGFNDLQTINPILASEAFGWDPRKEAQWSHKLMRWKCATGHIYMARIADRSSGDGCPICNGKKVLVGFNDLLTKRPEIARQAYGWNPKSVTEFSNKRKKWRCDEGHTWETTVHHRSNGRGCPTCSDSGYDPNEDGYLYFLHQDDWEMLQIGITNFPEQRIASHRRNGWDVIEVRGPMDGHLTQQWETAILRMLKAKGADLANSKIAGKFDGYSEAWSESCLNVKSIRDLMDLTVKYEESLNKSSRR
jgi:Zn finger protein HypA/HybF involved in hydrogenase expression/translation initiation factor IF-1